MYLTDLVSQFFNIFKVKGFSLKLYTLGPDDANGIVNLGIFCSNCSYYKTDNTILQRIVLCVCVGGGLILHSAVELKQI
jgi:hypothetical protein